MRESIGGAFLIKIMVIFIVLYNSLLAIAVNYAMAFRVKNHIIDLLEQYEGCQNVEKGCNGENCVAQYVNKVGYYRAVISKQNTKSYKVEIFNDSPNNDRRHYRVTTYITFKFPLIGDFLSFPITGETKMIYGKDSTGGYNDDQFFCDRL